LREDEDAKLLVDTVQLLTPQTARQALEQPAAAWPREARAAVATEAPARADWVHDPAKPFARLSEANLAMMRAYPGAETSVPVDDQLFSGAPRALPTAGEPARPAAQQAERKASLAQENVAADAQEQAEETPALEELSPLEWAEAADEAALPPTPEVVPAATSKPKKAAGPAPEQFEPTAEEEQPLTAAQQAKDAPRKLRLTLPTREPYMAQVKAVCEAHPGAMPAYLRIADEGITFLLDRAYWPDASDALQSALEPLLGQQGISLL
jgi:hypothetical protein